MNDQTFDLKEFAARRVGQTPAAVTKYLAIRFLDCGFSFVKCMIPKDSSGRIKNRDASDNPIIDMNLKDEKKTMEAATHLMRKYWGLAVPPREFLFQLCIHLRFDWDEALEIFADRMSMPFINYGNYREIVYGYALENGLSIYECYELMNLIEAEYSNYHDKHASLNADEQDIMTATYHARSLTVCIRDRYEDAKIHSQSKANFMEYIRTEYPFFHTARQTLLRDLLYVLHMPKVIATRNNMDIFHFLIFKSDNPDAPRKYVYSASDVDAQEEVKKFENGRAYVARHIFNTVLDIDRLSSLLSLASYIGEDDHLAVNSIDDEIKHGGRVQDRETRIKENLDRVFRGKLGTTRDLFIVAMLASGYNKAEDMNAWLSPVQNGLNKLDAANVFDSIVLNALDSSKSRTEPLAAFEQFCILTNERKYEVDFPK